MDCIPNVRSHTSRSPDITCSRTGTRDPVVGISPSVQESPQPNAHWLDSGEQGAFWHASLCKGQTVPHRKHHSSSKETVNHHPLPGLSAVDLYTAYCVTHTAVFAIRPGISPGHVLIRSTGVSEAGEGVSKPHSESLRICYQRPSQLLLTVVLRCFPRRFDRLATCRLPTRVLGFLRGEELTLDGAPYRGNHWNVQIATDQAENDLSARMKAHSTPSLRRKDSPFPSEH